MQQLVKTEPDMVTAIRGSDPAQGGRLPAETLAEALFRPMGVDGIYARTGLYEGIVERLATLITNHRPPEAEVLRFPPVMSRQDLEKSGYLNSFPNLLGCVCALHGTEADILSAVQRHEAGGSWTTSL